jgi:hypothetical protein
LGDLVHFPRGAHWDADVDAPPIALGMPIANIIRAKIFFK